MNVDDWTSMEEIAYLKGRLELMTRERDKAVAELKAFREGHDERRTAAAERQAEAFERIADGIPMILLHMGDDEDSED